MNIKKYNLYKFELENLIFIDLRIENDDALYPISSLLHILYPYNKAIWYRNLIQQVDTFYKIGRFEDVEVTLDSENNLIYLSDGYDDDYRSRIKNITLSMIIKMCLEGYFLGYNVMTKDNFIYLISSWVKLLENEPNFALLYLDDKNWYDVLPFDSQEAMEKFIAEHTQQETN